MILALYMVMLGLASGLTGVFARRLLAAEGFTPTFESGVAVAVCVACAFAAVQLAYVALLRLLKPSRSGGLLFFECFSNGAALLLVPFLLGMSLPAFITAKVPPDVMAKLPRLAPLVPLAFLGVFGLVHCAFKLVSLFSATQSVIGSRLPAAGWAGACATCALIAQGAFLHWHAALQEGRDDVLANPQWVQSGTPWGWASPMLEGRVYTLAFDPAEARRVVFRWANTPDAEKPAGSAQVVFQWGGEEGRVFSRTIELPETGWAELSVSRDAIPEEGGPCRVSWNSEEEPAWVTRTGLRPRALSNRALWVSGPHYHQPADNASVPSMVVVAVEGVGAENVTVLGYRRSTTPSVDRLASEALNYTEAYTPALDAAAGCMTMVTGMHPLAHGVFEGGRTALAEEVVTLPALLHDRGYVTAAFTEGRGPDAEDLVMGSGFERGFEWFDEEYPVVVPNALDSEGRPQPPRPAGSKVTLQKAADWIEAHAEEKFFVFIRLRELRIPMRLRRYGEGFLGRGRTPTPLDIFDTALADVDRQLGAFFERLRELPTFSHSVTVLTSPYGFDFSEPGRGAWRRGGPPTRRLTESSLRVPLMLMSPGHQPRERDRFASLEDVAPTLAHLAGIGEDHPLPGADLLRSGARTEVVSMQGQPVELSLRTRQWRFTWQSGRDPNTGALTGSEAPMDFLDISRYREDLAPVDNFRRFPESARSFRNRLAQFLGSYRPAPAAANL